MALKYIKMMGKEWTEDRGNSFNMLVYPAYHEWADSTLLLSDLRKFKFNASPAKGQPTKQKGKGEGELEELKALMDLRKTSGIFKKAASAKL